jgi:hypothetical protein
VRPPIVATKEVGPVALVREGTVVQGTCHAGDCLHTFVAFGEGAGETMARRHLVMAHPDVEVPA